MEATVPRVRERAVRAEVRIRTGADDPWSGQPSPSEGRVVDVSIGAGPVRVDVLLAVRHVHPAVLAGEDPLPARHHRARHHRSGDDDLRVRRRDRVQHRHGRYDGGSGDCRGHHQGRRDRELGARGTEPGEEEAQAGWDRHHRLRHGLTSCPLVEQAACRARFRGRVAGKARVHAGFARSLAPGRGAAAVRARPRAALDREAASARREGSSREGRRAPTLRSSTRCCGSPRDPRRSPPVGSGSRGWGCPCPDRARA